MRRIGEGPERTPNCICNQTKWVLCTSLRPRAACGLRLWNTLCHRDPTDMHPGCMEPAHTAGIYLSLASLELPSWGPQVSELLSFPIPVKEVLHVETAPRVPDLAAPTPNQAVCAQCLSYCCTMENPSRVDGFKFFLSYHQYFRVAGAEEG